MYGLRKLEKKYGTQIEFKKDDSELDQVLI